MKVREAFVSNSSSSSFILKKSDMPEKHLNLIREHSCEVQRKRFNLFKMEEKYHTCFDKNFKWMIVEDDEWMSGRTEITNFDMETYMEIEGINVQNIRFYRYEEIDHNELIKRFKKEMKNEG